MTRAREFGVKSRGTRARDVVDDMDDVDDEDAVGRSDIRTFGHSDILTFGHSDIRTFSRLATPDLVPRRASSTTTGRWTRDGTSPIATRSMTHIDR